MKKGGRWLIVLAVLAVVVVLFLAGPNGLIKLLKMKQKEVQLEKQIVQLQADLELTRQKVEHLDSDPDYLRKIAKERLQMVDPKDTLMKGNMKLDTSKVPSPTRDSLNPGNG